VSAEIERLKAEAEATVRHLGFYVTRPYGLHAFVICHEVSCERVPEHGLVHVHTGFTSVVGRGSGMSATHWLTNLRNALNDQRLIEGREFEAALLLKQLEAIKLP
jgi:hypothetical protein